MGHFVETLNKVAAEKHIKSWLIENGYSDITKELLAAKENALKANGKTENILVQIRAYSHPHRPFKLSEFEADVLSRRAKKLKAIAYAVYVILDDDGELSEELIWDRLSK